MAGPLDKITSLLGHPDEERRVAAAIVLGELGAKSAAKRLGALLEEGASRPRRAALDALTQLGAVKGQLSAIVALLRDPDAEVRAAAERATASAGPDVVPVLRARLEEATAVERRAIDSVLSHLGGKEAFGAILDRLREEPTAARNLAVELRQELKVADAPTRRGYRTQLERFLKKLRGERDAGLDESFAAAVKVLSFLEDSKSTALLLELAADVRLPAPVRQEALIGLRFVLGDGKADKKTRSALLQVLSGAALDPDRTLAQTAVMTLAGFELSPDLAKTFVKLARHHDITRANLAIQRLGAEESDASIAPLVETVSGGGQRGELATDALRAHLEGGRGLTALVQAFGAAKDAERAIRLRALLLPHVGTLTAAQRRKLVAAADKAALSGAPGWREIVDVALRADPKAAGKALRALTAKLRRSRKADRERDVLALLERARDATAEERFRLSVLELRAGKLDTRPAARRSDPCLARMSRLDDEGFDVAKSLLKDKGLDLEQLYYVGFHFAEEQVDLGADVLREVVKRAGRKKIGKAAKNKLRLVEEA